MAPLGLRFPLCGGGSHGLQSHVDCKRQELMMVRLSFCLSAVRFRSPIVQSAHNKVCLSHSVRSLQCMAHVNSMHFSNFVVGSVIDGSVALPCAKYQALLRVALHSHLVQAHNPPQRPCPCNMALAVVWQL